MVCTAHDINHIVAERNVFSNRYQTIVSALPDMLHILNGKGQILEMHLGQESPFPEMNYLGKTVFDVFPPDIAQTLMAQVHQVLDSGEPRVWEYTFHGDPDRLFEARMFRVLMVRGGQDGEVLSVIRDITAIRRTQTDLEALVESRTRELRSTNQALESFAYAASHDLREPLNKIISFGSRLASVASAQLDERSQQYVDIMQTAARRMQVLIDDILSYARLGKAAGGTTEVSLDEVVHSALWGLEILAIETNSKVTVGKLPTVHGYPQQLLQLFQNLLANAMKFRRPGVPPEIRVEGTVANDRAIIKVIDNGIGFEDEHKEHIFKTFARLHTRFEYPGTGLGLAVCRRITDLHGGRIFAEGIPNQGATFIVCLPLGGSESSSVETGRGLVRSASFGKGYQSPPEESDPPPPKLPPDESEPPPPQLDPPELDPPLQLEL
jgi:signal transduction histidine kinase